ncbi:MAG: hypothetical protein IT373_32025 [Polyangiaceae bacterium]|nr:hypothetical protein [Polyangiaceae bacterium]
MSSPSAKRHPSPLVLVAAATLLGSAGCGVYDAPPHPYLPEAVDGILADPTAPIVVQFSEPIDPRTLRLEVVRYDLSAEGLLADEDEDPATELAPLFAHSVDPTVPAVVVDVDVGGKGKLDAAGTTYTIEVQKTLPIGPRLAILVEAGITDLDGHESKVRQVVQFGFKFACAAEQPTEHFPSGAYFFLLDVASPIQTQIQLWGAIEVDHATGSFIGQFTNADRRTDQSCPTPCADSEVCRLLPTPACVPPSERAGTVDEFPDYVPNDGSISPTGYSFTVLGCVRDEPDGTVSFGNAPADAVVSQPAVTVKAIDLTASFVPDANAVLRGSGSFTATQVFLGTTPSGPGTGTHAERSVPAELAPPGIPQPPPAP